MSRVPILFGVVTPLIILSTVFVALRFYCRHFIIRRVGPDDWIMLIALLNVWGIGVTNVFQVKFGSGKHRKDLKQLASDPNTLTIGLKVWYMYQIEYFTALFFVKISILAFYRRLSPVQGFQLAIKIVAGFVAAFTVAIVFVNAFQCPKDPKLAWAITYPKGCYRLLPVNYAQASINIASDVVIYLLPLPSLLGLQLNRKNRVALIAIFSVGSVAVIASIARLGALIAFKHSKDPSYDGIFLLLWSQVELNIAVICASAGAIRPLLKTLLSGSLGSGKATYNHSSSSASGVLARRSHHIALQTFGGTPRPVEPGSKSIVAGIAAASESGENIVLKSDGGGGSSDEAASLDIRMEGIEAVGDGRSEWDSSRDLEFGR